MSARSMSGMRAMSFSSLFDFTKPRYADFCESGQRAATEIATRRSIDLPLPHHDDLHGLVGDVRMRHWRAFDVKSVAVEADVAHLLAADPALVPRRLDLGDDLAVFDPVAAGIGDQAGPRRRPIGVGLRNGPALAGHQRQPAALRRRDLNALGMRAVNGRAF